MSEQNNKKSFFKDYQSLMSDVGALTKTKENPFFKSKYVALKSVLEEAKRVCSRHSFIFTQTTEVQSVSDHLEALLRTTLKHSSGELIESIIPIVAKDRNDPQKVGAGLTYMRRYSLTCILGIEEADDDGKKASTSKKKTIEESISMIRLIKDKKTLLELKKKISDSKLYNKVQKTLLSETITEAMKNAS